MAQDDNVLPSIKQTIKDAPGTGVVGALKTFGGLFVPVVRINEGTRKRTVAAAEITDEAMQQFSQSLNQLAGEKGITFQGLAAQDPVASQKSARNTVYDATESWWKTGLGVLFMPGVMLRGKEVMNNSAISAGDRKLNEMQIIQEKLFQIADASGVDVSDLRQSVLQGPQSVKPAVRLGTDDVAKTAGGIAADVLWKGLGSTLRLTGAARDTAAATTDVIDGQMAITAQALLRIADKQGVNVDALVAQAQESGTQKVAGSMSDPGLTALAAVFSPLGAILRPKQATGQVLTTETEHQVGQLGGLTNAVESLLSSTQPKEVRPQIDSTDMTTMSGRTTNVAAATAEAKVANPQKEIGRSAETGQSRGQG